MSTEGANRWKDKCDFEWNIVNDPRAQCARINVPDRSVQILMQARKRPSDDNEPARKRNGVQRLRDQEPIFHQANASDPNHPVQTEPQLRHQQPYGWLVYSGTSENWEGNRSGQSRSLPVETESETEYKLS